MIETSKKPLKINTLYNMDCMDGMKQFPDKYFDLAVVDPPYGGGCKETDGICGGGADFEDRKRSRFGGLFDRYHVDALDTEIAAARTGGTWAAKCGTKCAHWDVAPDREYFDELARVSKNQIIWGGNYFDLPPTRCFLIWRKLTIGENFSMAMCEYAWTSFNDNAKWFACAPQGNEETRVHPTQKPVALYDWILSRYAKPGYKILDTHAGSGSCLVSCIRGGFDYVGFEIDPIYFQAAQERLSRESRQERLIAPEVIQQTLEGGE